MSNVNHPKHYNTGKFEVIDVIDDWKLDFSLGNAVKYIARAKHKGREIEDLQKAIWYLEHALQAAREAEKKKVPAATPKTFEFEETQLSLRFTGEKL